MSFTFSASYGTLTSSLWTPTQTGSFSLTSANPVFWWDSDFTGSFVTASGDATYNAGETIVTTFTDRIADIEFGQYDTDGRSHVRYASTSSVENYMQGNIGGRRAAWFWESSVKSIPDTYLTAAVGATTMANMPGGNSDRSFATVIRLNKTRTGISPGLNVLWMYGRPFSTMGYGLGFRQDGADTSGGDQSRTTPATGSVPEFGGPYDIAKFGGTGSHGPMNTSGAHGPEPDVFYVSHTSSVGTGHETGRIFEFYNNGFTDTFLTASALGTRNTQTGSNSEFRIGQELGNSGYTADWTMGELLIFNGKLSEDDRQRVEGYLAHKWGLASSLTSSHPFRSSAPLNSDGILNFTFTGSVIAPQLNSITGTYAVERDGGVNALTATIDVAGTATPGANYVNIFPKELNWEAGETGSKEFTVTFLSLPEQGEKTFIPFISGSGAATTQTPTGSTTTIIYPGLTQFSSSLEDTILEAGGTTLVTIVRTSGSEGALTANLNITGSATTGSDFTVDGLTFDSHGGEIFATASFADGESTYTFAVTASDDLSDETDETLQFTITGLAYPLSGTRFFPTATIGTRAQHTITILDLETGSLNFSPTFAHEVLATGSQTISFTVDRTIGGDGAATASIQLSASSTATASVDFEDPGFPLTLNWNPGELGSKTFNVEFKDSGTGTDRTFIPFISSATSASIGTASFASAQIVHPGTLNFSQTGSTVLEGATQTVNINRLGGTTGPVTATLEFTGPAVTGTNYTVNNLTLVTSSAGLLATAALGPGTSSYTYEIVTVDDAADTSTLSIAATIDSLEYPFSGNAFNPNASIGTGSVFTLSILDNESGSVNFSIKDIEFGQPGSGTPSSVTVTVNRQTGSDFAATATIDQVAGSATKNTDYNGLPATLNWENQEGGSKTFTLTGINGFGDGGATVIMGFSTLVNLTTGAIIPFSTATIANTIISEAPDAQPLISPDGVVNSYANTITSRKTKGRAVPFAYSQRTTLTIRNQDRTISGSIGGSKNG